MPYIEKLTNDTGVLRNDKDQLYGLWFSFIKDADLLSPAKLPVIRLLDSVKGRNEDIRQSHFDAVKLNAISVARNVLKDTKHEGGYLIFFEWSRLVARKFSKSFSENALLCQCLYSGLGTEAVYVNQEVIKPRGLSNDQDVSFMKVICPTCYNFLESETLSKMIISQMADLVNMKIVENIPESCCPNCKNKMAVLGFNDLSVVENESIKGRGFVSKEYIYYLSDPLYDFKSHWDDDDSVLGEVKIKEFIEDDLKSNSNLSPEEMAWNNQDLESPAKGGCFQVLPFIALLILACLLLWQVF